MYKLKQQNTLWLFFKFLVIGYVIAEITRIFFSNSILSLLVSDLFIISIFIIYLKATRFRLLYLNHVNFDIKIFLLLIALVVVLQLLNFYYIDIFTTIASLRSYLFPIPFLLIGLYFAKNSLLDYNKANFFLYVSLIIITFSILQIALDPSSLGNIALNLISPRDGGLHSYGDVNIDTVSSFFSSSKRYGRFLLFLYIFYSGIALKFKKFNKYFILIYFIGFALSGSREALTLFVILNIIYFLKYTSFKTKLISFSLSTLFLFTSLITVNLSEDLSNRLGFLMPTYEEYLERIGGFFPFINANLGNEFFFTGIGLGKFGQESQINREIYDKSLKIKDKFFNMSYEDDKLDATNDYGLTKIFIELGFFGLLFYLFYFFSILKLFLKKVFSKDPLTVAFSFYIFTWVIIFLKSHSLLSDVFFSSILFFIIGFLCFSPYKKIKIEK
jgi:hypothetical protein